MIYIGVDPGKNGGIAFIDVRPEFVTPFVKAYCYSDEELISLCKDFKDFRVVCFLEQVHANSNRESILKDIAIDF